jgi:Ca2+-binding EF-hand superfamily protein
LISSRDLKDKIDLFFYILDADGNGLFSFDEIKDICKMSFSKFDDPAYEDFRDELSEFFADYIFKLLSRDVEDEIPVSEFKDAIYHGTAE